MFFILYPSNVILRKVDTEMGGWPVCRHLSTETGKIEGRHCCWLLTAVFVVVVRERFNHFCGVAVVSGLDDSYSTEWWPRFERTDGLTWYPFKHTQRIPATALRVPGTLSGRLTRADLETSAIIWGTDKMVKKWIWGPLGDIRINGGRNMFCRHSVPSGKCSKSHMYALYRIINNFVCGVSHDECI